MIQIETPSTLYLQLYLTTHHECLRSRAYTIYIFVIFDFFSSDPYGSHFTPAYILYLASTGFNAKTCHEHACQFSQKII